MSAHQPIDEPIAVNSRQTAHEGIRPVSFRWRGRDYRITGLGRRWTEGVGGVIWHCFLAQTAVGDTFELRWQPDAQAWRVWRAWSRSALA
jgi:hypothetical protein